jgi:hypothetical protein
MKYTILVYESESNLNARTDGARKDAYWTGRPRPGRHAPARSA